MIGEKLGTFLIEEVLGTGAMGVVYRARSETTGKPAAVKVISSEAGARSKSYERFRREAEILQQFRHPNIVRFLAVGRYQGTSYFAMEYVAGETLEQVIRNRGPIPWNEAARMAIQVCEALQYAHDHGVVHRDLKPSNLMVSGEGQIKLTDFGIAKDLDATALTATGRTLGTAAYMAPEQIRGTPAISHKTDLYSLGVVMFQILTGAQPYEGTSAVVLMHAHLNETPPRPSTKVAEIPVALDKLVAQLMAKDPTERPWDAAAVAHVLGEICDKASRGESVKMVWATDADGRRMSSERTGTETPRKSKKKTASDSTEPFWQPTRARLEVGGLVLGLVAIVGFLGYMLWPPSAEYLYRQAERLMASEHRHDWETAAEKYLDPLDRRLADHPNHAYRAKMQEWRDRIALADVEGRSGFLEAAVLTKLNEPKDFGELQFVATYKAAAQASAEKDDPAAVVYWQQMEAKLKERKPDRRERAWATLARHRAAKLESDIAARKERVTGLLRIADEAEKAGDTRKAESTRAALKRDYGAYTDLTEILRSAGILEPPPPPAEPASAPAPKEKAAAVAPAPGT